MGAVVTVHLRFKSLALLGAAALGLALAGCAGLQAPAPLPSAPLHDEWFAQPAAPAQAVDIFALSPAMRAYLRGEVASHVRWNGPHEGLAEALVEQFEKGVLAIDYDSTVTRTAGQAFEARAGNCLSLVIMTAAFAKELGLRVVFQQVDAGRVWDRQGDLLLSIGHVNIAIGRPPATQRIYDSRPEWITIDFLPPADRKALAVETIDEARIVSMFLNNRAVEALAAEGTDAGYWWSRAAILRDPLHADAYNTLGVIYLRHGRPAAAESAFRAALQLGPGALHPTGNLALALERQGRSDEAQALRAELQRKEPMRPFKDYDEGLLAMQRGDYARAGMLFERELRRAVHFHELHLNMARVALQLGDLAQAQRQLELARENSSTSQQRALYSTKLDRLKELRAR